MNSFNRDCCAVAIDRRGTPNACVVSAPFPGVASLHRLGVFDQPSCQRRKSSSSCCTCHHRTAVATANKHVAPSGENSDKIFRYIDVGIPGEFYPQLKAYVVNQTSWQFPLHRRGLLFQQRLLTIQANTLPIMHAALLHKRLGLPQGHKVLVATA